MKQRLLQERDALDSEIKGLERAIALIADDEANPGSGGKKPQVKGVVLDLLKDVGTTGLDATTAVELANNKGLQFDRDLFRLRMATPSPALIGCDRHAAGRGCRYEGCSASAVTSHLACRSSDATGTPGDLRQNLARVAGSRAWQRVFRVCAAQICNPICTPHRRITRRRIATPRARLAQRRDKRVTSSFSGLQPDRSAPS